MQHIQFITAVLALCSLIGVSVYTVNHEDTVKMEVAAKSGLIQCREDNYVLWKKECNK
jgi:hypothetical protein